MPENGNWTPEIFLARLARRGAYRADQHLVAPTPITHTISTLKIYSIYTTVFQNYIEAKADKSTTYIITTIYKRKVIIENET